MEDSSARTLPEVPPASPDQATLAPIQSSQTPVVEGQGVDANASSPANPAQPASESKTEVAATPASPTEALPSDAASAPGPTPNADVHAQHAAGESGEDGQDGDDAAEGEQAEGQSADATGEAGTAPDGTPGKRKRRRRRKRKDGSGTSAGDVAAPESGAGGGEPRPEQASKKKESHAPFAHRFGGAANKRHAFAVGEVVAGRVQKVEYGVIVVDLFGKAIAMADEYEPRDIPPMPEPPVEAAHEVASASQDGQSETVEPTEAAAVSGESEQAVLAAGVETGADAAVDSHVSAAEAAAVEALPAIAAEVAAQAADSQQADGARASDLQAAPSHEPDHEHEVRDSHEGHDADDADDDHDHDVAVSIEPAREKPEAPALGQVFKGRVGAVSESGHIAILNRIIDGKSVRAQLNQFREQHKRVHGMVYGYNRGGFDVLVEGLRAFCPASAMSLEDIVEPLDFVGKKLEFLLPASKAGSKDIIVSRRSILERLQRRKTKDFLRGLTPGQTFKGKVTAVRDFGLFVDIGGVEGLVHQSELSYAFGVKPHNVAKLGDEIDVQILRIGGEPRREKDSGKRDRLTRVSLSVKSLLTDPWDAHAAALSEGAVHKGKVVRAAEFGAFIEIVPEVEGLLHITELGRDLKHANQAVREGEEIFVAIERIDRRARRISLSKLSSAEVTEFEAGGLSRDDGAARNLRQGNNVKLKIERIEPRCVFGRVTGTVGKRGRAFIPNSETGTERGSDLRKRFPIGSELEAKIIGIDRDGSLKCSIKAMQVDEERQAVKNYRREAAKQGFGTFGDLLRAKLGEAQSK
jgi:small subunit ribosomal protein S1